MNNVISLVVDGKLLAKTWSDIRVKRSMASVCSSFEFVTTQGQPFDYKKWPIKMGAECIVLVDGEQVLTGYIEDINVDYDKDTHTVQVAGRDRTCDLVDCHESDGPFEFGTTNPTTVLSIVKSICKPFSISVVVGDAAKQSVKKSFKYTTVERSTDSADVQKAVQRGKSTFYIQPGDPIIGALYRITRWAKVYMLATTDGNLSLTLAGSRVADSKLVLGKNVLRGGLKQSDKERFSVYRVRGYGVSSDGLIKSPDWLWMNGRYPETDPDVYPDQRTGATRYRPFGQLAETAVKIDGVGWMSRAEAQYRTANSRLYNYTVQGWREKNGGSLWEPNTLVAVNDPLFGLDGSQLLIESVDYTQTDQGTLTQLGLCSKEKYTAQAEINKIKTIFDEGPK